MSGSVEYFSDWQDRTMKDLMSIIVANDDPKGEPLRGLAIFAKRLKCYQMKHSNAVVIGNVLENLYMDHGKFSVRFVGHEAHSDILVACYQTTPDNIKDYLWLNTGKNQTSNSESSYQTGDKQAIATAKDEKQEKGRFEAIEDEWEVVSKPPAGRITSTSHNL